MGEDMIKDMAKYYKNRTHAVVHLSKKLMDELDKLGVINKSVFVAEFDENTGKLTLQPLDKYKGSDFCASKCRNEKGQA